MHTYVRAHIHTYKHERAYKHTHICMYVYVYIHIYTHTHTFTNLIDWVMRGSCVFKLMYACMFVRFWGMNWCGWWHQDVDADEDLERRRRNLSRRLSSINPEHLRSLTNIHKLSGKYAAAKAALGASCCCRLIACCVLMCAHVRAHKYPTFCAHLFFSASTSM